MNIKLAFILGIITGVIGTVMVFICRARSKKPVSDEAVKATITAGVPRDRA